MSYEPIPLKVTNSFYYVKNSVKPMPYVMWGNDFFDTDAEIETETDNSELKDNTSFLSNLKKNIKK